jgi:allophanate hydrolase
MQQAGAVPRSRTTAAGAPPLAGLGIAALRAGYRAAAFTPVDVVTEVLARIAARGDDHVWISRADDLLARASEVDTSLPLGGIPFAVKDNIDALGLPTTAACPDFAYRPTRDAPVVRRLLDAGALLVGKTNLDQFATGLNGTRSPYGACESVYGGGLIAGGSSSGSAVAVAAGLVSFALGTDTAGSGRVPAALNGIVGIKPTRGRLSTEGVVPACRGLDCVSVFATTVAEAGLVANIAAPRSHSPVSIARFRAMLTGEPPGIGVPAGALDFAGDQGFATAYWSTVEGLPGRVVPVDVEPLLEAGRLLYEGALVAERLADLEPFLAGHPDSVLPVTRHVISSGARFSAADLFRDQHRVAELRRYAEELFAGVDALLLPTIPTTYTIADLLADPLGPNTVLGRFTQFANPLDLCAVAVPMGSTVDGRPFGVTLFAPAHHDDALARLAAELAGQPAPPGPDPATPPSLTLAVVGKHLRGEPRHHELVERGAVFAGVHRTAPVYRLYRMAGGVPGLVRVEHGGAAIEVELWSLPVASVGGLLAGIGAPLSVGRVRLADGTEHAGFLGEAYATAGAEDITHHGGWREYLRQER